MTLEKCSQSGSTVHDLSPRRHSIRVPHPDFIAMPAVGRTVSVYAKNERAHSLIDLLLVTKLETPELSSHAS
jgi:hypothetical protein